MELSQIRYFLTLAKTEHVSEAASLLGVSQPSLSRSMATLEKELGVQLFDRRGNHIYLNDYGRNFLHYAQSGMDMLNSGAISVKQSMYDVVGSINVLCFAFADPLSGCVAEYARLNPKIRLSIYQRTADSPLAEDKQDFYYMATNPKLTELSSSWVSAAFRTESTCIIMSPRYRKYPPEVDTLRLRDLKEDYFIAMPTTDNLIAKDFTYQFCSEAGFLPKIFCSTEDFLTKVRMVDEGLAVALLPECCLPVAFKVAPTLRAFFISDIETQRTLYLLRRRTAQMTETARDFWNFAMDYYGVDPAAKV